MSIRDNLSGEKALRGAHRVGIDQRDLEIAALQHRQTDERVLIRLTFEPSAGGRYLGGIRWGQGVKPEYDEDGIPQPVTETGECFLSELPRYLDLVQKKEHRDGRAVCIALRRKAYEARIETHRQALERERTDADREAKIRELTWDLHPTTWVSFRSMVPGLSPSSWPWIHNVDVVSKDGSAVMDAAAFLDLNYQERRAFLFAGIETPEMVARRAAEAPAQVVEAVGELVKLIAADRAEKGKKS
jgi:hypothetical protein